MWIHRTLWVGKVGIKAGLKWPSSATGPSLLGSTGPRAGQVKRRMNLPSRSILFCTAWHKVYPYHMPTKQDTNSRNNNIQVKPVQANDKAVYTVALSSAVAPSSYAGMAPLSSYSTSIKGAKGGPSGASSIAGPHITCSPTSSIWTSLGRMPNSSTLLDARSCPSQKYYSSSPIICCGIGSYHSSGSLKTQYPPWWKWSLDFSLES